MKRKNGKKLFSVFAFVLGMAIAFAIPVSAAQRLSDFDTMQAPIMKGTPSVDGEKDEMYNYSLEFDRPIVYHYDENGGVLEPGSFAESDFGITIKATGSVLWDENNLYIFLEVTDDELYASNDDTLGYWMQGSGVIVMYYPGDSGGDNVLYRKLRIANGAAAYNASPAADDGGEYPDDCVYAYKKTSTGWNLEIQIKLGSAIKEGDLFQFALQVCSTSPDKNMGFAHVNENAAQITFPFKLGGAVVIPEPETEAQTEAPAEAPAAAPEAAAPEPAPAAPVTGDFGILMVFAVFAGAAILAACKKRSAR